VNQHQEGTDLAVPELAKMFGDEDRGILLCIHDALGLLLKIKNPDPAIAALIASKEFKSAVARNREYLDVDVTLAGLAGDLGLEPGIMAWAFFEARARLLLAQKIQNLQ
jgi:hypothetical protein